MNWNIVIYIVASIVVAISVGNLDCFTWSDKYYRRDNFNFPVFFVILGLLAIAGLFIFKYGLL